MVFAPYCSFLVRKGGVMSTLAADVWRPLDDMHSA